MKKTLIFSSIFLFSTICLLAKLDAKKFDQIYSSSRAIYASDGTLLRLTLAKDDSYRLWKPLAGFPSEFVEAVKIKEDRWFDYHIGFNPFALFRSLFSTYILNEGRYGGSTITMQLARLHFSMDTRNIWGKVKQIAASSWMEWLYSKDEIIEAYLNLVPLGRNIQGYFAGSYVYFRRSLNQLNLAENLALIQIPQNPAAMSKVTGQSQFPDDYLSSWRDHFQDWVDVHSEDENLRPSFARAIAMKGLDTMPFLAPHFTTNILANTKSETEIISSLDINLQKQIERKIERFIDARKNRGIENASALVMRWTDGHILASVGSANFFNNEIAGQVDGTHSKRSPGSTLKPFLYALAFEQGILHPESLVYDLPQDFSAPDNVDSDFLGPISAADALAKSRNIPAADLLRKLNSKHGLYEFLKYSGISNMRDKGHYGTSLIMGSLDVTMVELAGLYGILASNGLQVIPTWEKDFIPPKKPLRFMSAEASVLVKDVLKRVARPAGTVKSTGLIKEEGDIFWKTGTSVGYRDAWTIGIWDDYIVAVWLGDFSGLGHPEFMGIKSAAPLFFQLMDGLKYRHSPKYALHHAWTENIVETEVCSLSGELRSKFCPFTKKSLFIPGTSPIEVCDHHRPVEVLTESNLRACSKSKGERVVKVFETWDSQTLAFFKSKKLARAIAPDFSPECNLLDQKGIGIEPKIISPRIGLSYQVPIREKTAIIPLKALVDSDVKEIFWFVGKALVAKLEPQQDKEIRLSPGNHLIKVIDDHGRTSERFVKVQMSTSRL